MYLYLDWLAVICIAVGIILNNKHNRWFIVFLLIADAFWILHSAPRGDYAMIVFCLIVITDNVWDWRKHHKEEFKKRRRHVQRTKIKEAIETNKGEDA